MEIKLKFIVNYKNYQTNQLLFHESPAVFLLDLVA